MPLKCHAWLFGSMLVVSVCGFAAAEPTVRLSSIGYLPDSAKVATVVDDVDSFTLVRVSDGTVVLKGKLTSVDTRGELPVKWADFSSWTEPGEYFVELANAERSPVFKISGNIFEHPFYVVTRAMYLWRCGCHVRAEYEGNVFEHAACHLDDARLEFVGGDLEHRDGTKGWHDAGDYNKYVTNANVTVGVMLRAWEDFGSAIKKFSLDIPESGGALPDFLAEVKWELDWLLTMQAADGTVFHKLSAANFSGFVMPEDHQAPRYFSPWGSAATADFVAMMAAAARIYAPYDEAFAARCMAAAEKSHEFLRNHTEDHRPDQSAFSTGGYGTTDWDDRLWADAEMWEVTGNTDALNALESRLSSIDEPPTSSGTTARGRRRWRQSPTRTFDVDWDWGNVKNLALLTYLFSDRPGRNQELVKELRESLVTTADRIAATGAAHAYGRLLGDRYYWGTNGGVARQVVVLTAAYRLAQKPEYRKSGLDALNHLFGRNVYGRSFVTGLGHDPPLHPHDRRSGADEVDAPWPGYLVGGAHPRPGDWHDEQDDYRTNEIAINWNAALIYALAAYLEPAEP